MGADVDEGTAALLGFIRKHAPGGHATAAQVRGLGIVNIPQPAVVHHFFRHLVHMEVAVLVANGKDLPGAVPGLQHFFGVCLAGGHGLFAQDVLARLHSGAGDLAVRHVGGQHVHGIDGGILQQLVVIGVHLRIGRSVCFGGLHGALLHQVAESNHFGVFNTGHTGEVLAVGNTAAADETQSDFLGHNNSSLIIDTGPGPFLR